MKVSSKILSSKIVSTRTAREALVEVETALLTVLLEATGLASWERHPALEWTIILISFRISEALMAFIRVS